MSSPQVLIAAGCPHITVTRYRCLHLQEQLAANGMQATVEEWYDLDRIDGERPLPQTALVLQRVAMTPALGRLIERMQAVGRAVLFDVDDLIFEPQLTGWHRGVANLSAADQQSYGEGVRRYAATLERCNAVLAASPLLAELAARHGPTAYVHRNALGEAMLAWADELYRLRGARRQREHSDGERVVLGYGSGTATHDVDFAEAAPALLDVLTRYAQTELWIAGPMRLPDEFTQFGARVRRFPLLGWRDWFELAANFDIALAPLEMGNLFCRAKSEIKFIEAGALGLPTVASAIDPFAAAISHGENGFLAANPAAWIEPLAALVADVALRRRVGDAARRSVLVHYSPEARVNDLALLLSQLAAAAHKPQHRNLSAMPSVDAQTSDLQAANVQPSAGQAVETQTPDAQSLEAFTPLTIHWLVTEPMAGSGGHTNIFRMIRHLVDFGHSCHVHLVPVNFMHNYTPTQLERYVDTHFMPTGATFQLWNGKQAATDATIATFWGTVSLLQQLALPGRRYYLVQDFEPYFYPAGSEYVQAENSYRQGLHCLTLGSWLANLLREQYGAQADAFDFSVDTAIYRPNPALHTAHPRIAFYARPSTPRRAYELGIEALQLVKQRHPGVEIILYGAESPPLPSFAVTNVGLLNAWELASLFASCDVGLVLSTTNPSLVPLEMMACRCAVVDLASSRAAGLLEDGVNCRLATPTPTVIADALLDLVWDQERRSAIVETAYRQVKDMSWEHSVRQIEAVLLRHTPPAQRVAARTAGGEESDMLVWQIHQLLDASGDHGAQIDDLRSALYRTLAEKARLVQQVQQLEQSSEQTRSPSAAARVHTRLADRLADATPGWLLGRAPLSKLWLSTSVLSQSFCADRSHLCRIELRFAPRASLHTGTVRISLYTGELAAEKEGGQLVASTLWRAAEMRLDRACTIDFAPQPDSYGKIYTLCLAADEVGGQPPAIWHFRQVQLAEALLKRGRQPLAGQLAVQPFYGEHKPLLPPRQGPALWDGPVRPAPLIVREVTQARSREAARLASLAGQAFQQRGLRELAREILNYIRWQFTDHDQG